MTTLDHLRKLVDFGWQSFKGIDDDPCCYYCNEDARINDEGILIGFLCNHAPDCPWVAAKSHVEQEDCCHSDLTRKPDSLVPTIYVESCGKCGAILGRGTLIPTRRINEINGYRGFTLIELLVVMVIILIVGVLALPSISGALSHRQVSEGARTLQAALAGARDAAIRNNAMSGIRLLPDPAFPISYAAGQVDPSQPLACNRIVPIGAAPDYYGGTVGVYPGTDYSSVLPYPALVLEEVPGHWMQPGPGQRYIWEYNEPTSWYWNLRVGDKLQINGDGSPYWVVGPTVTTAAAGNSELFANLGAPGVATTMTRKFPSPDGQSVTLPVEYLFLVNGRDDNANGWIDEGFDGVDNNAANGVDELAEWETEAWVGSAANGVTGAAYSVSRRPCPLGGAREALLPSNVVIDLTTWGSTLERSRLPVNAFTGYVDIMVNPNGTVVPTTIYSTPSSVGLGGAFMHFWVAERADVTAPGVPARGTVAPTLPLSPAPGTDTAKADTVNAAALKGEYRLVTLFARTGLATSNSVMPFDWANNGTVRYDVNRPFEAAQQGAR